jgi:hypothetical protein
METRGPDAAGSASSPRGSGTGGEEPDKQGHQRTGQGGERAKSWLATQKARTVQGLGSVGAAMGQASHKLQLSDLSGRASNRIGEGVTSTTHQLSQKAAQFGLRMVGKDVRYLVVGGALVYAGFLTILAAAVNALGLLLPRWLSGFIVGVVTAGVGYFLIQKGQKENEATERQTD